MTRAFSSQRADAGGPCRRRSGRYLAVLLVAVVLPGLAPPAFSQLGGIDGWKDAGWGQAGSRLIDVGPGQVSVGDMVIQPDGRILLAGQCNQHACTVRLRPNGSPDTLYGPGGIGWVKHENLPIWRDVRIVLLANGRILLSGGESGSFVVVARLMPDGSTDASAGGGSGYHRFDFHGRSGKFGSSSAYALGMQQDGKILVAGAARTERHGVSNSDMAIARLDANLSGLDLGFGGADGLSPAGTRIVPFDLNGPSRPSENLDKAAALHVYPDGRILLAGTAEAPEPQRYRAALVRLESSGAFDQSFGDGGKTSFHSGIAGSHYARDVAVDRRGRIVVAGEVSGSSDYGNMLASRRHENGQVDMGFGVNGFTAITFDLSANSPDYAGVLALQSDGRILLAGHTFNGFSTRLFAAARLTEDGLPDPSFGAFGKSADRYTPTAVPNGNPSDEVSAIAVGNGGLMIAGKARTADGVSRIGVARLTLDIILADGFQP